MIRLVVLETADGKRPFHDWFDRLEKSVAKRVTQALYQLRLGNFSDSRTVGGGVFERRVHTGPGCRIYFARQGDTTAILLAGGVKKGQSADIVKARQYWRDYKSRR